MGYGRPKLMPAAVLQEGRLVWQVISRILGRAYGGKLTLITCVNDGIFDHRIVATALPVEPVAPGET